VLVKEKTQKEREGEMAKVDTDSVMEGAVSPCLTSWRRQCSCELTIIVVTKKTSWRMYGTRQSDVQ